VRIYIVAEKEYRIKTLMKIYKLNREKAREIAIEDEKKRLAFLEGFGAGAHDDLLLYRLVINTGLVDYDIAVDSICNVASSVERPRGPGA
jgi:cytidylate kinase